MRDDYSTGGEWVVEALRAEGVRHSGEHRVDEGGHGPPHRLNGGCR